MHSITIWWISCSLKEWVNQHLVKWALLFHFPGKESCKNYTPRVIRGNSSRIWKQMSEITWFWKSSSLLMDQYKHLDDFYTRNAFGHAVFTIVPIRCNSRKSMTLWDLPRQYDQVCKETSLVSYFFLSCVCVFKGFVRQIFIKRRDSERSSIRWFTSQMAVSCDPGASSGLPFLTSPAAQGLAPCVGFLPLEREHEKWSQRVLVCLVWPSLYMHCATDIHLGSPQMPAKLIYESTSES